jgi:putative transposase
MFLRRASRFRLYPTEGQAALMAQYAGACRAVWNLGLEQRRDWWRPGRSFSYTQQCLELTQLRAEVGWLRACPAHVLQQALRDLHQAYKNWWNGCAAAPTWRKKGQRDSFRFPDPAQFEVRRISRNVGAVRLPKLGWVRFRSWIDIPGDLATVTVVREADGWHAAVQWEKEVADPVPSALPAVGIDLGVQCFAALSDGTLVEPGDFGRKAQRRLARAQRSLARTRRGSANWRKQRRRVARLHLRVHNARKDYLHKLSTKVAKGHGAVVMEDLRVKAMSASARGTVESPGRNVRQKAGLNRSILDQGWGEFRRMLGYKLAERGGTLVLVEPAYTSQTCSACGHVAEASRVSRSRFACVACGHADHADVNAARSILRRAGSPSLPAEAARRRADEAGTVRRAA